MTDRNFDQLANRFERNLYGSLRGKIRLQLVSDGLLEDCAALQEGRKKLRVLDAGCGLGQMIRLMARHDHDVTACDVSSVLLARARQYIAQENSQWLENIHFVNAPVQILEQHIEGSFDLVIFHAVLEWLENPRDGLQSLLRWLKPGGELSLLFYNRNSLIFKNLLRGNFRKVDEKDFRGDPGSLTPLNPLDPNEVGLWLDDMKLEVMTRRGIRTFYEFMDQTMHPEKQSIVSLDEIVRMEKIFGSQEPYRSLGRYQLWHCRKNA